MAYDLRNAVREILDSTDLTDPGEISRQVVDEIPDESLRDVLLVTMRAYVRSVFSEDRPSEVVPITSVSTDQTPLGNHPPDVSGDGASSSTPTDQSLTDTQRTGVGGRGSTSPRSWKQSQAWERNLRARFHVGERDADWKVLKDCTREDLLFAATERRKFADNLSSSARRLDAFARIVTQHGVTTFGDLPAEVQMRALTGTTLRELEAAS